MRRASVGIAMMSVALSVGVPAAAGAQGFGIGPRFSFVRGDLASESPSTRFVGGTMRLQGSSHTAFELALDYRSYKSDDLTTRVRETPFQGSLLLFPVRRVFSPYLLGGFGIYSRMFDQMDSGGRVTRTDSQRKTGWHLGGGAEILINRHTALFGDYRFRFVKFGEVPQGSEPINIPGKSIIPGLDKVTLSHQGSMWTSGIAFYF